MVTTGDVEIWPRAVHAWQTSDGRIFTGSEHGARDHQARIYGARIATDLLVAGHSVGVSMRVAGMIDARHYPELDGIFATTQLIIEHWQCRSEPGYTPHSINSEGEIMVYGDAGSWSGPYGHHCSLTDVVRYWVDTMRKTRVVRCPWYTWRI